MPRDRLTFYAWYPADYRADTRHLTRNEHFAYRETLDEIFLVGQEYDPPSIPDDSEALSDLWQVGSEEEYRTIRRVLIDSRRPLLSVRNGRIYQNRLSAEIAKGRESRQKRQAAASKRWQNRAEMALESTNEQEAIPNQGSNGNGGPRMSEKQFLFYAARIGKWLNEYRDLYLGNPSALETAFARDIGISWKAWEREQEYHQ